jgi:hypothetical protein
MSSTSIYENLPLKKLDSESESLKNSQNIPDKQKKRKSTPDIQKISPQNNIPKKPKSSRSISEMFFNRNHEANDTEAREIVDDKAADDSSKKVQSTPTSTLDDGYESCNSTPLVSGLYVAFIFVCCVFHEKVAIRQSPKDAKNCGVLGLVNMMKSVMSTAVTLFFYEVICRGGSKSQTTRPNQMFVSLINALTGGSINS